MHITLQIAIMSHLSDAQTLMSFEGQEKRSRQEINFALEALDRYPEMAGSGTREELDTINQKLTTALELGSNASQEVNDVKEIVMRSTCSLKLSVEDLDHIFYARS